MTDWTLDEIVFLRRSYGSRTIERLCDHLKRDAAEVEAMAREMYLAKDKKRFAGRRLIRWSDTELDLLRLRYPTRTNLEIARELGRSAKAVLTKATNLGLRKDAQRLKEMGQKNVMLRRNLRHPPAP